MEQAYSRWLTHVTEPELLEQLNEETAKAERDAYTEYLAQYGEYAEKRMAIEEQKAAKESLHK